MLNRLTSREDTGIVCTVLGGMLSLWVIARLSSAVRWQQTWAPPLAPYEWVTLGGAAGAAMLLIVGLLWWSSLRKETVAAPDSRETEIRKQ